MANNGIKMVLCLPIRKDHLTSLHPTNELLFLVALLMLRVIILMKCNVDVELILFQPEVKVCRRMINFYSVDAFILLGILRGLHES